MVLASARRCAGAGAPQHGVGQGLVGGGQGRGGFMASPPADRHRLEARQPGSAAAARHAGGASTVAQYSSMAKISPSSRRKNEVAKKLLRRMVDAHHRHHAAVCSGDTSTSWIVQPSG